MKFEKCLGGKELASKKCELYGYAPAYDGRGDEEIIFSLDTYGSYYALEHGADRADFEGYCVKLEDAGFECVAEKTSNGNAFATYFDGENIVNVSHVSYKEVDRYIVKDISYVLIAVDSVRNSSLPCKCEEFKKITDVVVSMVDGFIVRLEDGRFLVIDSSLDRERPVKIIYEELCRLNVREGKPTVAAWMFTHAHSDHVGGFLGVMREYGDKITVESVIHGFPGVESYHGKNYMEYYMEKESTNMTNLSRRVKNAVPTADIVIAHTGQTFEYPGVKLEIMFTAENLYKQQIFDTNMSSVVYMLTMPCGKLLALGDAVDAEAKILRNLHGKELKSDAVILAHHAFNGGDEELYYNVGATAAIWPINYEHVLKENLIGDIANHFDFTSVKRNFIMTLDDEAMRLYDGMSEEEIAKFDRKSDIAPKEYVDFEARKNPRHVLTEMQIKLGFGNAPRYYGTGEETQILDFNEETKTYTVTVRGASEYNFDYYRNSLKRDGYRPDPKTDENGVLHQVYTGVRNRVLVDFYKETGVLVITVGEDGKDVLVYGI